MKHHNWAKFWTVDFHVHTPGSDDAKAEDFGTPNEIVQAAIDAGLDAIAVTDHNTAAWCDRMTEAAQDADLVVLPGVEISTPQGHLLGIWEQHTKAASIEDVLIQFGIDRPSFGALDIVTTKSMTECAALIQKSNGIAIAAHVDKERGILKQPVQTHVNQLLESKKISAFEYVWAETPDKIEKKLGAKRNPALVQGSDTYSAELSRHSLTAIGIRRTFIKAARPDLVGIKYALDDPDLRVSVVNPESIEKHPTIDSIEIDGGFLDKVSLGLSPDLNSLLGGTGAGKSLVLEVTRFALEQQVDKGIFEAIYKEVDGRLSKALGEGSNVTVELTSGGQRYRVKREYGNLPNRATVEQYVSGEWALIQRSPSDVVTIAAFSQGEILEYARQPVGRVGLVDVHLDLSSVEEQIENVDVKLAANDSNLISAKGKVDDLTDKAAKKADLQAKEKGLAGLFDKGIVEEQRLWTQETSNILGLKKSLNALSFTLPVTPDEITQSISPTHDKSFKAISDSRAAFLKAIASAKDTIDTALESYKLSVDGAEAEVEANFAVFKKELEEKLEESGNTSLSAVGKELESVQKDLASAKKAGDDLDDIARPELARLEKERGDLLDELRQLRTARRALRRTRAQELNRKTAGFVKIDIPAAGDYSDFRSALDLLKVGSRVREVVLDRIAASISPYSFAKAIWNGNYAELGDLPNGVTSADLSRLHTNIADRNMWSELLQVQRLDRPDVLDVKFKKPEGGSYVDIEDLSHGQKCTAILVILLADGDSPVVIDQPEDALHAPWIEDYLVDRLRKLRGTRQYIFATRSAGLVVSADSEQLITMLATATSGEIQASGSLERHDLNRLALHHLEGGKIPFGRRTQKLRSSI